MTIFTAPGAGVTLPNGVVSATFTDSLGRTGLMETTTNAFPSVAHVISVTDSPWGAKGDAKVVTDGSIPSGSNVMTSVNAAFTNADVNKIVVFQSAGPNVSVGATGPTAAGVLIGYISSVSGNTATLMTTKGGSTPSNASNTVASGGTIKYGAEDSAAWSSAIAAVSAAATAQGSSYGVLVVPGGRSYMLQAVTPKNNVMVWMYGATVHLATSNATSTNSHAMMFDVGSTNVSINNWHLRGGTFPGTGTEAGPSGLQGIMYWHNTLFGQNGTATYTDISVKDAVVTNWATGVWDIRGGARIRFEGNTCRNCSTFTGTNTINVIMGGGGSPVASSDVFVQNNYMDGNGAECIAVGEATATSSGFDRAIITGNNFQGVGGAAVIDVEWSTITTGYGHTVIIANNICRQTGVGGSAWGISAQPTNMPANVNQPNVEDQISIRGNIINSSDAGINVGASDAIVEGNILNVQAISQCGILAKGQTSVTVTADLASSTTLSNVSVAGGGSVSVVNGTQLDGNAGIQNGTYLVSGAGTSTWTISLPATTGSAGQSLTGWIPINRVQILNNIVQVGSAMAHNPIFAHTLRDSRIHGNILSVTPGVSVLGQGTDGILLQRSGWCDVDSNRINYAPTNGIELFEVNDCHVQRNRIYNPSQGGSGQAYGIKLVNISGGPFRVAQNSIVDDQSPHLMQCGVNASASSNGLAQLINNDIRGAITAPALGTFATGYGNTNDITTDTTLVTTTNASWKVPPGATNLLLTLVAGGGGGAGAGSSSAIANQTGGSGGAAGSYLQQMVAVGANTTLSVTVGAGGASASGGSVTGGTGVDGGTGGATIVTGTGISLRAEGGGRGLHSNGNASATSNGIVWGTAGGATSGNAQAGGGGAANATNGLPGGDSQGFVGAGGQGGAPASVSNGGVGGGSSGFGAALASTSAGTASATSGTNGTAAPVNTGGGGGGGGGGANGGTGGNGGAGGSGYVLVQVVS